MIQTDIYTEFLFLLIALIGIFFIFGTIKLADHKLYYSWRLIFLAYILFVLGEIIKILDISGFINAAYYKNIGYVLFLIFITLGIIKFNREIRHVAFLKGRYERRKHKKKRK